MKRVRKSIDDLLAKSNQGGAGGGIKCPKCGCRDHRVKRTTRGKGVVRRERHCRNCGYVVFTEEKSFL